MQPIILITNDDKKVADYLQQNFEKNDFIISLWPEKTEYSIDQIRIIQKEIKYFNPQKRVYVFFNFHYSSIEAQNAFLKILEEPPTNVSFILVVENLYRLLPTIISRVKILNLQSARIDAFDLKIKETIAEIKQGKLKFLDINTKEQAKDLILSIIYIFKNEILNNDKNYLILKECLKNLALLEHNNLNPQLTLDNLLIFIYKCYTTSL